MMKEQWKDKKFWLILFSEIAIIGLIFYFGFLPLVRGIVRQSDKIQETKIDKNLVLDRISRIKEARQEHEKITNGIDKMNVLLEEEEEVRFFKEIESIAESTGNGISIKIIEEGKKDGTAVSPAIALDKEKKEMLDKLSYKNFFILQISLKGEYGGLVNFLHRLENMDHYLTIISVNAQKVEELPSGELMPLTSSSKLDQDLEKKEKLSSTITAAIYKK